MADQAVKVGKEADALATCLQGQELALLCLQSTLQPVKLFITNQKQVMTNFQQDASKACLG